MTDPATPADDIIEGAAAIAAFMGGKWNERRVYQVREMGRDCPIRKREGVGIYAFKSELLAWLKAPETLPQDPSRQAA